jgi:hypothetical protein
MKQRWCAFLVSLSAIRATALWNALTVNSASLFMAVNVYRLVYPATMKLTTMLVHHVILVAPHVEVRMMTIASLAPNFFRNIMEHVSNIVRTVSGVMEHPEKNSVYRVRLDVKPVR